MKKKYYKVVRKKNGKYYSLIVKGNKNVIEYKINTEIEAPKWLREKGYHIIVFDSITNAMGFKNSRKEIILEVKCKGIITDLPIMKAWAHVQSKDFSKKNFDIIPQNYQPWPTGTIMAKIVNPIREVA